MSEELTPDQELEAAIRADLGVGPAPSAPASDQPEIAVEPTGSPVGGERPPAEAAQPPTPPVDEEILTWRGQEQKVTRAEAKRLAEMGFDYTRKTMEIADQRRQVEATAREYHQREVARQNELRAFLGDRERLSQYLVKLGGSVAQPGQHVPAAPHPDVDDDLEVLSKAQATQMIATAVAQAKAEVVAAAKAEAASHAQRTRDEIEIDRMSADYRTDFDRTVDSLVVEKFPVLADFGPPDIRERIKADGKAFFHAQLTLNPGQVIQPDRVKEAMVESARRWSAFYDEKLRDREKKFALQATNMTRRGPEPSGGTPPPGPPAQKLKLNDPKLDDLVLQEIQSIMGR